MGTDSTGGYKPPLTLEESAILHGIARGDDFSTIAKSMFVASKTVSYHATKLRKRFRARNLPELVATTVVLGYLTGESLGIDTLAFFLN